MTAYERVLNQVASTGAWLPVSARCISSINQNICDASDTAVKYGNSNNNEQRGSNVSVDQLY
ncbi:MAG: hypothetical protein QOD40_1273 [Alphaproteobacteria bacterium]|jgi:hypothetical protein|nr:hypothetical protein [Alphaproteobacteria bacterium]